ncbi:ParB/RepB/Spo0J family partition protein [candidate division KSB1 bacterium]|nr:ParB/RepB/Spo0J family partition protein [candidate division KSB1 bacterium]
MVGKTRLGRGLGALIPDLETDIEEPSKTSKSSSVLQIPVSKVEPNPFQPRQNFDPIALEELKNSIAEKGIIQPITVREFESRYQLIAGERRLRAVLDLNFETIPAYVLNVQSDEEMLELSLIENIQREDLNPIDVARGYQRLLAECHLTQEEVAQKVGKERSTVTNFLRLLKLPDAIQESLIVGDLSMGHARALLSIEDRRKQLEVFKKAVKSQLSVRKVEALVKKENAIPVGSDKKRVNQEIPLYIENAENTFRRVFATQVRIKKQGKSGKIEIEFYSDDELERILGLVENL